jgi:hypothetical protein
MEPQRFQVTQLRLAVCMQGRKQDIKPETELELGMLGGTVAWPPTEIVTASPTRRGVVNWGGHRCDGVRKGVIVGADTQPTPDFLR